jgi:hypothetical protein
MAAVAPAKVDPTPVEVALSSGVDRLYLVWAAPARHDEAGLIARMVATRLGSELAAEHRAGRLGEVAINFVGGTAAPLLVVGVELDGASPAAVRAAVGAALGRLWRVGGDDEAYFLRVVALHGLFGALTAFHGRTEIWADYLQHDASMGLFSSDTGAPGRLHAGRARPDHSRGVRDRAGPARWSCAPVRRRDRVRRPRWAPRRSSRGRSRRCRARCRRCPAIAARSASPYCPAA